MPEESTVDYSPRLFPISSISLKQKDYPSLLATIHNPPPTLFVRGNIIFPYHKFLCIVGTRDHSPYAREVLTLLLKPLRNQDIVIVSGLARGIDSLAHLIALENNLPCIGVPGSGINDKEIQPTSSRNVARTILENGGGLMTEIAERSPIGKWTFAKRNRIMAGLSHAILVIEARERSGSLITAHHGLNYNREVLAVPGPITSTLSAGCNSLISRGATVARSYTDILESLNLQEIIPESLFALSNPNPTSMSPTLSILANLPPEERDIIQHLSIPLTHDSLLSKTTYTPSEFLQILTSLEIQGIISISNGYISKTSLL